MTETGDYVEDHETFNKRWYANEEHQDNFKTIAAKFPLALKDNGQYRAACYIAAFPEIFKCFDLSKQVNGPFDWYFAHLDPEPDDETTGSTAGLTGGTYPLVELALNLWNGHKFDLEAGLVTWDAELYTLALRAMDLRRRKPSVKL